MNRLSIESPFRYGSQDNYSFIVSTQLSELKGVKHGFTTKKGGKSEGHLSSLNIGISRGDLKEHVAENYRILAESIGFEPDNVALTRQVHGKEVRIVNRGGAFDEDVKGPCDALITNVEGIALFVFTADCVPILLYDPTARCIGAVHAGWRGTANGVLRETIEMMKDEYGSEPSNICAAIGPSIGGCCFEVDFEVYSRLRDVYPNINCCTDKRGEKYYPDLKELNKAMLLKCGLKEDNISTVQLCTKCEENLFWSHRRDGEKRGLQGAVIVME
jgi:YfiH family protein